MIEQVVKCQHATEYLWRLKFVNPNQKHAIEGSVDNVV